MIGARVKRSISNKFMLAVLVTTFSALLVAATTMLMLDMRSYRASAVSDATTQSDIVAGLSLAALDFNDPKAAAEILAQLKSRSNIMGAAIYTADGRLFAQYVRPDASTVSMPSTPGHIGYKVHGNQLVLFSPITRAAETLGTVYLTAQYPFTDRLIQYALVLGMVILGGLLVAFLVSYWLQRAVTKPILAVTGAVQNVIHARDFSTRVQKTTEDEIGFFVDAFNSMLSEIGERAVALEASHRAMALEMEGRLQAQDELVELNRTLEQRVRTRTAELERVHEQLRHSQKLEAIGQLTGGVAHDFNNVLQVISGNLQLLQMSVAGNPQAQQRLETAAYAADRGAKLSSQLLAFARRQPLSPVATNLSRIVRGMDDLLRRALGEEIQVETIVAGGLWTTLIDPNQIENVILNLAINARDAMKGSGKLTIELGNAMLDELYALREPEVEPGQYVMLAITDTGCGMPREVLERAFEPFFTTKREGEGTGLGLSMAYGFVKQSQGHIKIYSEVGHGTSIKIYLPRSLQPEVQVTEPAAGPAAGGSETILVAEDDLAVQATTVDILCGLGYTVLKANDGQSALNILQSGVHVDLLFTDVVMPGPLRSPDLAKQAKQLLPAIEVLFTSGYTQNAIVHGGRLDPGVELISKPYRKDDLARKIRYLLANKKSVSLAKEALQTPPHDAIPNTNGSTLCVLFVEDNDDARHMTGELIGLLGHQVHCVANGEEALNALTHTKFDVLLTDVTLPGMSGLELARQVHEKFNDMTIIISSGYGEISPHELGFQALSLPKPFELEKLQAVLSTSRKADLTPDLTSLSD